MDFKPGIYEDLDYPTYDSIPAWRSHDLTAIAKCPFSWKFGEFKESPALLEGRVQHSVFLEHHKFFYEYAIEPMVDRRTKAGKAEYAAWLSNEAAKKLVNKPTTSAKKEKKKGPVLLLRSSSTRQTKHIQ